MRINTEAKQYGNGRSLNINIEHTYLYWVSLRFAAKRGWSPIWWKKTQNEKWWL